MPSSIMKLNQAIKNLADHRAHTAHEHEAVDARLKDVRARIHHAHAAIETAKTPEARKAAQIADNDLHAEQNGIIKSIPKMHAEHEKQKAEFEKEIETIETTLIQPQASTSLMMMRQLPAAKLDQPDVSLVPAIAGTALLVLALGTLAYKYIPLVRISLAAAKNTALRACSVFKQEYVARTVKEETDLQYGCNA